MGKNITKYAVGFTVLGLLGTAVPVGAQTFTGYYPSGSSGSYASTITFAFDPYQNQITVNIQNTTNSVNNIGQAISGLSFSLANFSGSLSIDPNALVGYEGTTSANTTIPTDASTAELVNSALYDPWNIGSSTAGVFALGNPKIIPGLAAGQDYTKGSPTDLVVDTIGNNPNGSISSHEPSLFGTGTNGANGVTFTLDASSDATMLSTTAVTGYVKVYFGTGPDIYVNDYSPNTPTPIPTGGPLPIPATLPLVATGAVGLVALRLRKRKSAI